MSRPPLIASLAKIVGAENVLYDRADLMTYSYDAAVLETQMPAAVVRPLSSQAMGEVVAFCNAHQLPLIVRGSGTNLSGGTIPLAEGVVLLTNGLNRILESTPKTCTPSCSRVSLPPGWPRPWRPKDFSTCRSRQPGGVHPGRQCG